MKARWLRCRRKAGASIRIRRFLNVDTTNILFICGGAFAGLEKVIRQRTEKGGIGFGAVVSSEDENINISELFETVEPEDLIKFGLIPELIGRLPVIATLAELDEEALINILTEPKNALVKQYQALFAMEGVELEILPSALRRHCQAGDGAQNRRARPALDCGAQPARHHVSIAGSERREKSGD